MIAVSGAAQAGEAGADPLGRLFRGNFESLQHLAGLGLEGAHADPDFEQRRVRAVSQLRHAALVLLRLRLPNDEPQYAARGQAVAYSSGSGAPVDPQETTEQEDAASAEPPRLSWRDPRLRPWVFAGLFGGHAQAMVLGISGFLVLDRLGLRDRSLLPPDPGWS